MDPNRDSVDMLRDYVSWTPGVTGASGPAAEVDKAITAFKVIARKVPLSDGGYTMDHTAYVMLFDREGWERDECPRISGLRLPRSPSIAASTNSPATSLGTSFSATSARGRRIFFSGLERLYRAPRVEFREQGDTCPCAVDVGLATCGLAATARNRGDTRETQLRPENAAALDPP